MMTHRENRRRVLANLIFSRFIGDMNVHGDFLWPSQHPATQERKKNSTCRIGGNTEERKEERRRGAHWYAKGGRTLESGAHSLRIRYRKCPERVGPAMLHGPRRYIGSPLGGLIVLFIIRLDSAIRKNPVVRTDG